MAKKQVGRRVEGWKAKSWFKVHVPENLGKAYIGDTIANDTESVVGRIMQATLGEIESPSPMKIYHIDWSPDGKYVAFSRGPKKETMGFAPEIVGIKADGWNICVADAMGISNWMPLTSDGNCNKEPDWIPAKAKKGK